MKILVISTQVPVPARDGASLRVLNITKQLAAKHEVTFCTLLSSEAERNNLNEMLEFCDAVYGVVNERSRWTRFRQILQSFFRPEPYLGLIYFVPDFERLIRDLAHRVDVAQGEFPYGGQYLCGLPCKTVLDEHNVEADILRHKYLQSSNVFHRLFYYFQYRKMQQFEAKLCRAADCVLATSNEDGRQLRPFNPQVFVVPNGVTPPESLSPRSPVPALESGARFVTFTGLMSYRANEDAMLYFTREVWPRVVRPSGERLLIVGKNPSKAVLSLACEDITVTGEVPAIEPFLAKTSVFVAPLRIGSGTRIKILEAMAHGLPVVSTSLGCMGLDVRDKEHLLVADDAESFAGAISFLLANPAERNRLSGAAQELVRENYTWDRIGRALHDVYEKWELVSSPR